jgi:two-component system, OmpR family, phosphate regulon response regulator PhoB
MDSQHASAPSRLSVRKSTSPGTRNIHLGPTAFRLLEFLLENPGRVFTRAQLLDRIWGQAAEIGERTVNVHVGRLRKRLSRGSELNLIRTVRETGYAFDETFGKR